MVYQKDATDFPVDYPCFYSNDLKEWINYDEYASIFYENFADFMMDRTDEQVLISFMSDKLSKEREKYALVVVYASMIGDDIFLEGVKRVNYFDELPNKEKQNNAYLSITTNDENKLYYKGKRIYVGKNNRMSWVKDVILAYVKGEINLTGTTPDYEGMVMVY